MRRLVSSGPVLAIGAVLLAVAIGIGTASLHLLHPPPPPSATTSFIQVLGGKKSPF